MDKFINKVQCIEALELMKQLPDKSIDLVLTDPDYNAKNIGSQNKKYDIHKMNLPDQEYKKFCLDWFKEAQRLSDRIVFTPGIANIQTYPQATWIICWYKACCVSFNRMGGFNAWEPILIYGKPPKGNRLPVDYLNINTLNWSKGPEKNHPCPKPPKLISKLVQIFSKPNELILDPFMGSWTTAKACQELGRNFIGAEISENYCELGKQRLAEVPLLTV